MYGKSAPFLPFIFQQLLFYLQLRIDQWVVGTATFYQFIVRSDLCDDTIVDYGNLVRIDHSRQAMGNKYTRSAFARSIKCILDNLLNPMFNLQIQKYAAL